MTTVTITIDDPMGADSNQIFLSAFQYSPQNVFCGGSTGGIVFNRYSNGVIDPHPYELDVTGNNITFFNLLGPDLSGDFTSMTLRRLGGPPVMHMDFTLDGGWSPGG